jgi:hypothetical protein
MFTKVGNYFGTNYFLPKKRKDIFNFFFQMRGIKKYILTFVSIVT